MGFSLIGAAVIIGISIVIAIETFTGSFLPSVTDFNDSYNNMKDRIIDKIQTDINISSVSTPANGSNYDLNFTVENTGSTTLKTSYFTVLINGTIFPFTCSSSYITTIMFRNYHILECNRYLNQFLYLGQGLNESSQNASLTVY